MINPRLTRGEYWLLETVAELATPIMWLDREDLELIENKPGHGMPRPQLIETMRKLFLDGLITAHRTDILDEEFVFTKEQLDAALNETRDDKPHYYSLTHKGGQYWEAFASPNWNRYIDVGYQPDDKFDIWFGEIICAEEDYLNNYCNLIVSNQYDVDEKTIQRDILKPWEATYWKELPMGHRIRFHCREKETNSEPSVRSQIWYDNLWYNWR